MELNPDTWHKVDRYATIFSTQFVSEIFSSLQIAGEIDVDNEDGGDGDDDRL